MSAKCHENKCKDQHYAKYQHFAFCSFTILDELKEHLIAVWFDFWQDIIDTAIDQWREHLRACVREMVDILNILCEQTLANNWHFLCVFGSSGFDPSCQLFTVLMLDGR